MTRQPQWKLLANLGDASPVEYGGYFVYEDTTGEYPPEAELLMAPDDDDSSEGWTIYRFCLDQCTFIDGVLSDNPYHPTHSVWFAPSPAKQAERSQDSTLIDVARFQGLDESELVAWFCSDDPIERAQAYRAVGEYHGFENLDSYPLHIRKRSEVEARYKDETR